MMEKQGLLYQLKRGAAKMYSSSKTLWSNAQAGKWSWW